MARDVKPHSQMLLGSLMGLVQAGDLAAPSFLRDEAPFWGHHPA